MKRLLTIAATIATLLAMSACSADGYTDQSQQSLRYEKGASQGGKFHSCVEPGEKIVTNDALYPYPKTQREAVWDSDHFNKGSESADYPDLEVKDRDGNSVFLKMKVQFFLNTSCEQVKVEGREYDGGTLQVFHEFFGKTREAYFTEDGGYGAGWLWAMTNYIAAPTIKLADDAAHDHTVEKIWLDTATKNAMAEKILSQLQGQVDAGMQTDLQFYKNFSVNIYKAAPSPEFQQIYERRKTAATAAETAELNLDVKVKEAEANAKIAEAEARVRKAEIAGYGGPQWFACIKSIEKNLPCFTPNGQVMVTTKQ